MGRPVELVESALNVLTATVGSKKVDGFSIDLRMLRTAVKNKSLNPMMKDRLYLNARQALHDSALNLQPDELQPIMARIKEELEG